MVFLLPAKARWAWGELVAACDDVRGATAVVLLRSTGNNGALSGGNWAADGDVPDGDSVAGADTVAAKGGSSRARLVPAASV